ncbi:hypothetical protein N7527_010304 [Penicillium freii]|uniref:Uncharacterized protein n=1 Tax=Penicillium freii TaxID=48697 RepID=A0A117NLU0_PENFR|nr:hypothetical protein N7527_010304 [Penicillium freii]KUM58130.1 hypothetical protein ACN42_g9037 [Penicillium freii]
MKMKLSLLITWSITTIYNGVIACLIPITKVLIEHYNREFSVVFLPLEVLAYKTLNVMVLYIAMDEHT